MDVLLWARKAEVGETVTYAHSNSGGFVGGAHQSLTTAYAAHEQGMVFLAQKRYRDGISYQATRINYDTAKRLGLRPHRSSEGAG